MFELVSIANHVGEKASQKKVTGAGSFESWVFLGWSSVDGISDGVGMGGQV